MIQDIHAIIEAPGNTGGKVFVQIRCRLNVPDISGVVVVEDIAELFEQTLFHHFRHRLATRLLHVHLTPAREPLSLQTLSAKAFAKFMRFFVRPKTIKPLRRSDAIN